jgi:hypothetical protein
MPRNSCILRRYNSYAAIIPSLETCRIDTQAIRPAYYEKGKANRQNLSEFLFLHLSSETEHEVQIPDGSTPFKQNQSRVGGNEEMTRS